MTSAVKSFLVLLLTLPLLIYIGNEIGSEEYLMPTIAGILIFASLVFGLFFRGQRVECLVMAMLLGGYIIGNRGFAQIYVVQPLFIGELGMATILVVMMFRYATSRELIIAPHLLTRLIFAYLAFSFLRLCFDWRSYGIDAVRDAALAYYAVFFFAAYQLGRHEETAGFIDRALIWAFLIQAVVAIISVFAPEWLDVVTIRGTSPLLQKGDITATFCSLGIFFLTVRADLFRSRWLRSVFVVMLLVGMMLSASRSALVAFSGGLTLTWVAARRGFVALPLFVGIFGIAGIFILGAGSNGRLATARDHLMSIVDVSGTYEYQTDLGDAKQGDNQFRRVLWESIFKQTAQDEAWVAGKGFGYDFIPAFEQEYNRGSWENLRSAHNYYITVFGRLGIIGLGLFLAISYEIMRHGLRAALAMRRGERRDPQALAYWCAVWAILIAGTFGVVLEGPMGAIPFWSMLGLALASNDRFEMARQAESLELTEEGLLPRLAPSMPRPAGVR